ncbi:MAG: aldehyde dehydrogenase [Methanocalculus sp. MSAO_Arc1]|uniref:aldehyde dehydrogenase family protein n=1 Tax=Methanocalculus TaxID=71151 RepID=UPI000FF290D0|nr:MULTISPECIES: aldehyde dehydrogenase family protein [unclassified Methanocalculus]MCP1661976.1 acyl-CoA reductase-like NAD-dependent aldehyde dehydrogenase [Methanocalculus sp. AMF5]RQD81167.1 MAG: aldehyde dehydrogenase [Methanocalculus sp. MSAO_Arc1]
MQMMIGDSYVESVSEERIRINNPANGTECGEVPAGKKEDLERAVSAAEEAFRGWADLLPTHRGIVLFRSAGQIRREADRLALILTTEQGKPLREAKDEVLGAAAVFEYYAGSASLVNAGYIDQMPRYGDGIVQRKPLGVCGAIIPWNMPILIASWKIGAALVTGNTLVLKPSIQAPMAVLALGEMMQRSGLPPGVLNIITGGGEAVGDPLARHRGIAKISFTGGIETGHQVARAASESMKRLTLELGGNDPMIVCSDVEPAAVADAALALRMYNCGQICTSPKRMIVLPEVYDAFCARLEERVQGVAAGDPTSSQSMIGPLNNAEGLAGVEDAVSLLADEGAQITWGKLPDGLHDAGFFHPPVLATGCGGDEKVLREEIFGPVIPVIRAADLDDALQIANNTSYGLGASIWTRDMRSARVAADELEAGIVWINQHMKLPPEVPFGGVKESGIGRENGRSFVDAYTEEKTILISR